MSNRSGKLPPHVDKDIAEREKNFDRQKDTVYFLVFEPKPGVTVGVEVKAMWHIRLPGNPEGAPHFLANAIAAFEENLELKAWSDVAARYFVEADYAP